MSTSFQGQKRRNLVIVCAGDNSCHPGWRLGGDGNFDLYISYFGNQESAYVNECEYYQSKKGMKWPVLAQLLSDNTSLIDQYENFWLPDDDIIADTKTINRMFDYFSAYQLSLAQPALSRDSYYSWEMLLQDPRYELRFTNFVEVMVPIFSKPFLRRCLPTFKMSGSGWGLDFVWPTLCDKPSHGKIAILDKTPVKHSRPVGGGELYDKMGGRGGAGRDMDDLMSRYGLSREDIKVQTEQVLSGVIHKLPHKWNILPRRDAR